MCSLSSATVNEIGIKEATTLCTKGATPGAAGGKRYVYIHTYTCKCMCIQSQAGYS